MSDVSDVSVNESSPAADGPSPITITSEEQFRAALSSAPGIVLVDFVAVDCAACEEEGPLLAELASCNGATVLKVDVDQLPELADALHVDGTPTLYLGTSAEFLKDLAAGDAAAKAEKRIPKPKAIKEVTPGPRLLRKLKCAR